MLSIDIRGGERPSKICKSLGRSRVWLRKWIGRYDNFDKSSKLEWFRDESRAPKNVRRKTDSEMEQLVVNVRKSLMEGKTEDTKYRCIGADEIQFRMHELGYSEDETPSMATIKRIIKRNGNALPCRQWHRWIPLGNPLWWFKRGNDTSDANPRSDTRC